MCASRRLAGCNTRGGCNVFFTEADERPETEASSLENFYREPEAWPTNAARDLAGVGLWNAHGHESQIAYLRIGHSAEFAYCKPRGKPPVCISANDASSSRLQNRGMSNPRDEPTHFLAEWREFRQLTQEQLAEGVGTDKSVISLLEDRKRGLSNKWLHKLARALKTTPGAILDYDPNMVPTALLEIWAGIPDEDRPKATSILEAFRRKVA